mmetsp:Transcript_1610/g.4613  ORF Transcript_1610/g.4613 Transcript_1610/m.4613 type:complete len:232 (+) Transcript_1610:1226-1921(+)
MKCIGMTSRNECRKKLQDHSHSLGPARTTWRHTSSNSAQSGDEADGGAEHGAEVLALKERPQRAEHGHPLAQGFLPQVRPQLFHRVHRLDSCGNELPKLLHRGGLGAMVRAEERQAPRHEHPGGSKKPLPSGSDSWLCECLQDLLPNQELVQLSGLLHTQARCHDVDELQGASRRGAAATWAERSRQLHRHPATSHQTARGSDEKILTHQELAHLVAILAVQRPDICDAEA